MKNLSFSATRYTGTAHVTIATTRTNPGLTQNHKMFFPLKANPGLTQIYSISLPLKDSSKIEGLFKVYLAEQLSEGDNLVTAQDITLTVEDFPESKLKKLTTARLEALVSNTKKMLGAREMAEEVLRKRGKAPKGEDTPEPEEGGHPEGTIPEEEPAQDTKPARIYKKCLPDQVLKDRLAAARTNYKRFCQFFCTQDKETYFGIIRSARLDKRSGFIQYRIEILQSVTPGATCTRTGSICGKGDDSRELTIFTSKPEEITL